LTFFMLLEGPDWRQRCIGLLPKSHRAMVERIGAGVYQAVGGSVTGNLLAALPAGARRHDHHARRRRALRRPARLFVLLVRRDERRRAVVLRGEWL
jgi:hypothetical protein